MKGSLKILIVSLMIAGAALRAADERPPVSGNDPVRVQYQIRNAGSKAWSTSNATLKGTVSESMMINTLSARHPRAEVRILSAALPGRTERVNVRYQIRRGGRAWGTANAVLTDAPTESMARNQLSARNPGAEIRILNMVRQ